MKLCGFSQRKTGNSRIRLKVASGSGKVEGVRIGTWWASENDLPKSELQLKSELGKQNWDYVQI